MFQDGSKGEVYTVDKDRVCQCRAGEFGRDCKHIEMVEGTFQGDDFPRRRADDLLDEYLDKVREEFPDARVVSLAQYRRDPKVTSATAIAYGVLGDFTESPKLVLWTRYKQLTIRLYCFRDLARFRRVLRAVRRKGSPSYEKPDNEVGAVGKTYGTDGDDIGGKKDEDVTR